MEEYLVTKEYLEKRMEEHDNAFKELVQKRNDALEAIKSWEAEMTRLQGAYNEAKTILVAHQGFIDVPDKGTEKE